MCLKTVYQWQTRLLYLNKVRPDHYYNASLLSCTVPGNECPEEKYLNRHVIKEVAAACAYQPDVWRDLGIELLGKDGIAELDVIKANNTNDVTKCCSKMLSLWLQRQIEASWNQLIEALEQVKLNRIAKEIKRGLKLPTEVADTMQAKKITATQHQDQAVIKEGNLQKKSSNGV